MHGLGAVLLLCLSHSSWAAITFVSVSSSTTGATNRITLPAPAGMAASDVMIAFIGQNTTCTPLIGSPATGTCAAGAAPAGWTLLQNTSSSGGLGSLVYYKVTTSADLAASYSWTTQGSGRTVGVVAAFRGVNPSSPIESSGARANASSTLSATPSLAASSANAMLLGAFASKSGGQSATAPAGMVQIANVGTNAGNNGVWSALAYAGQAGAGPTGVKTASFGTAAINIGALVVLKAALTGPDHYELSLPSAGQSCAGVTATLRACAAPGAPCSSPYTGVAGTSATLSASAGATLGSTSVTFDAQGVASTSLSYPTATNGALATVSIAAVPQAQTGVNQCCTGGTSCTPANSCSLAFNTSGFIISNAAGAGAYAVPSQTAGSSSTSSTGALFLRAVKTSSTTQACETALVGATTVNWSVQCNNPASCSAGTLMSLSGAASTAIGARPIATGSTPTTAVSMTFDANGNAPFSFNYADVGQVTLHAAKPTSGLSGSTNPFVVRPAGFALSGIRCTALSNGNCAPALVAAANASNPGASSASGAAFIQAGRDFSATVTATVVGGAAAPNYGKESVPESVTLTATRVLPASGGASPALSNAAAFGAFSAGVATGTAFQWDEVGIIKLTPSVASASYLGTGDVTGAASGNVGRFIPASFASTPVNRCAFGAAFTYSGQPFAYTLTAQNASGATVFNYDAASGFSRAAALTAQGALAGTLGSPAVAAGAFTAGVATFAASAGPVYTYASKKTAPSTLTIRAVDADQATSEPVYGGEEGSVSLRSGQLRVYGASGGDKAPLLVPLALQYWSGAGWVTNADDACSAFGPGNVALTGASNALAAYTAGVPVLASGAGHVPITPSASSGSSSGTLNLAVNLGSSGADQACQPAHSGSPAAQPWLRSFFGNCSPNADRDPSATLGFGIYGSEAKRQVHIREMR